MGHPRFSGEEIARRGEELYKQDIRRQVETEENIGKMIAIDIETGDYAIADDPIVAADHIFASHPGAALFGARIGYDAAYSLGGTLTRTLQ